MEDLTVAFKEYCRSRGADLVGIASPERFDGVPPQNDPRSVFPDARAIVVIGRRITRGTLRGWEEGTNRDIYEMFGYSWLDKQFVALTNYEAAEWLEDRGWEATPVMCYPPDMPPQGVAVRAGGAAPNVNIDMNHAAVAAGLGEIGLHGLFLSPRFGPRQRFQIVITDAPLRADELCGRTICSGCGVCATICPLGAIDTANVREVTIAGKAMRVAAVDEAKCRRCQNGARPNAMYAGSAPDRLAALCCRTCVDLLERGGRVDDNFRLGFRQREPWAVDELGRSATLEEVEFGGGCADPEGFRKRDREA